MQPTVLVPRPAQPVPPAGPTSFVYDGRIGELYVIYLKNVLLAIVTLGIYRFWGKVNVRRYLWSRTSLMGDRFEYTGTGGELFLSFVIVMVFFVVMFGAMFGITFALGPAGAIIGGLLIFALYPVMFYFFFLAQFTALRYRLTRTRWRGIRGAMSGSPWKYGFIALGWWVLSALSMGLLAPIPLFRTMDYRLNNVYFGTAKATFNGNVSDIFLRYLAYYFSSMFIGVIAIAVVIGVLSGLGLYDGLGEIIQRMAHQERLSQAMAYRLAFMVQITIYVSIPAVGLFLLPLFCWYAAFLYNYMLGHTSIAGGSFAGKVTMGRMFGYLVINFLIMILTLGFGFPWVLHRIMKFIASNIEIRGSFDVASIQQNQMPMPRRGEGLLDMLDPGFI